MPLRGLWRQKMDFLWSGLNVASGTLGGVLAAAAGADRKGGGMPCLRYQIAADKI